MGRGARRAQHGALIGVEFAEGFRSMPSAADRRPREAFEGFEPGF